MVISDQSQARVMAWVVSDIHTVASLETCMVLFQSGFFGS